MNSQNLLKAADSFIQSIRDKRNEILQSDLSPDLINSATENELSSMKQKENEEKTVAFNDSILIDNQQDLDIQSEEGSDKSNYSQKKYSLNPTESSESNESIVNKRTTVNRAEAQTQEKMNEETSESIEADEDAVNLYEKFKRNSAVLPSVNEDLFKIEALPLEKSNRIEDVQKLPRASPKNNSSIKEEKNIILGLSNSENYLEDKKKNKNSKRLMRFFERK